MSVRACEHCGRDLHTRWYYNVAYCPYCHRSNRPERPENATTCVCCGAVIPEGRMICPNCDAGERIE